MDLALTSRSLFSLFFVAAAAINPAQADEGSFTPGDERAVCAPLALAEPEAMDDSFVAEAFQYADADCQPRVAYMLGNDEKDPQGTYGGCMHAFRYRAAGEDRFCVAKNKKHPGFGFTVNHVPGSSVSSRFFSGTFENTFVGQNHALRTYHWVLPIMGEKVQVTTSWFFATGRSHPVFSVTYDLSQVAPNKVFADSRAPYGDIAWDGGAEADVSGLGWGDHWLMRTTSSPVSLASGWRYDRPNRIPHVLAYTNAPDAEMGLVQTEQIARHDAGGGDGYSYWKKTSPNGPMPKDSSWPFQLGQYEMPYTLASKRIAWGLNYGAVGQSAYPGLGDDTTQSGYPYQSYSTFVVLGEHTLGPTERQIGEVEGNEDASLTADAGASVATEAPAGVGRTDMRSLVPVGFDPVLANWLVHATGDDATPVAFTFHVQPKRSLVNPLLIIDGWQGEAQILLKGPDGYLREGKDFFMSFDSLEKKLYITLHGKLEGDVGFVVSSRVLPVLPLRGGPRRWGPPATPRIAPPLWLHGS